jgi:hypothetical protein
MCVQTERTIDGSVLTIPNMQLSDTGRYTCSVEVADLFALSADTYLTQPQTRTFLTGRMLRDQPLIGDWVVSGGGVDRLNERVTVAPIIVREATVEAPQNHVPTTVVSHSRQVNDMVEAPKHHAPTTVSAHSRQVDDSPFGDELHTGHDLYELSQRQKLRHRS